MAKPVYVEIDAILDTRYTILSKVIEVDVREYITRETDNFRYVGNKHFKTMYDNRNRLAINDAKVTYVLEEIKDIIVFLDGKAKLVVNLYPYVYIEEEEANLRKVIAKAFNGKIEVVTINEEVNHTIFDKYSAIVMYEGIRFFNRHAMYLKDSPRPACILLAPAIVESTSAVKDFDKFCGWTMSIYSAYINLQLVKVNRFCAKVLVESV